MPKTRKMEKIDLFEMENENKIGMNGKNVIPKCKSSNFKLNTYEHVLRHGKK